MMGSWNEWVSVSLISGQEDQESYYYFKIQVVTCVYPLPPTSQSLIVILLPVSCTKLDSYNNPRAG